METQMRHMLDTEGPFTIHLEGGATLKVAECDGGGMFMREGPTGQEPYYEVHCYALDGGFTSIPQQQIEKVVDPTGAEVEFGNQYLPGHPRPLDLPDVIG